MHRWLEERYDFFISTIPTVGIRFFHEKVSGCWRAQFFGGKRSEEARQACTHGDRGTERAGLRIGVVVLKARSLPRDIERIKGSFF